MIGKTLAIDFLSRSLKRVFGIDIRTCSACGGAVRLIACIEDAAVIEKILTDLDAPSIGRIKGLLDIRKTRWCGAAADRVAELWAQFRVLLS